MPYKDYEKRLEHQREYYLKNIKKCKDSIKDWQRKNPEKRRQLNKRYRENLRFEMLCYYSNGTMKCACPPCGETRYEFLTIDHINNDGAKHRKELGNKRLSGWKFYEWLRHNKYPEGYQVLCMNCNFGKRMNNGICPHAP